MMFRRERAQPYWKYENVGYGADYLLWLNMFFNLDDVNLRFAILPERLVNYVLHDQSMTS